MEIQSQTKMDSKMLIIITSFKENLLSQVRKFNINKDQK